MTCPDPKEPAWWRGPPELISRYSQEHWLGATSRRILVDFFLEGAALALLSGVAGLAFIAALTSVVNSLPMPAFFAGLPVDTRTALTAILALGTVAIVAALPPAWRASNLTPVEALRFER